MTLRRYLAEVGSYRDHLTELAYLEASWDAPDRSDWYAMQVAAEIRKSNAKEGTRVDTNDLKLKFVRKKAGPVPRSQSKKMTDEERAAVDKAYWMAAAGYSRSPTTSQEK